MAALGRFSLRPAFSFLPWNGYLTGANVVCMDFVVIQGAYPDFPSGLIYLREGYPIVFSGAASYVADIVEEFSGSAVKELEGSFRVGEYSDVVL